MIEKHVVKDTIIRIYGAPINELKAVLRQVSELQNVEVKLFGKNGEFLVHLVIKSNGEAAAEVISENAAAMIESALGSHVYGRGTNSLAHVTCGALIEKSAQVCCATEELGELLATEFASTKRGEVVFDFGKETYKGKNSSKIFVSRATLKSEGAFSPAAAIELATAARKAANMRFGTAITAPDTNGMRWIAIIDKNKSFVRQVSASDDPRSYALSVLDIIRRVTLNIDIPMSSEKVSVSNNTQNTTMRSVAIMVATITLFCALAAGGCLYFYDTFYIPSAGESQIVRAFK